MQIPARLIPLALLALAACGPGALPLDRAPQRLSALVEIPREQTAGAATSVIRAYGMGSSGERVELPAAICKISSAQFQGQVITPQEIRYPRFIQADRFVDRGRPDPLTISCTHEDKTGTRVIAPITEDRSEDRQITEYNNGRAATRTFTALTANTRSTYPWIFPDRISVVLD